MLILNFHGVGLPKRELVASEQSVWIGESLFNTILDYACTQSGIELTFDDANESDYSIALPALQARGMKAQFFVVAERMGRNAFLSREQLNALVAAGMAVGNHGMKHRPWAKLAEGELREELVEARDRLEQLTGAPIRKAACPFGSYNRRVISALRNFGYESIYTSDGGAAQPEALIQPRNSAQPDWDRKTIENFQADRPKVGWGIWTQLKLLAKQYR